MASTKEPRDGLRHLLDNVSGTPKSMLTAPACCTPPHRRVVWFGAALSAALLATSCLEPTVPGDGSADDTGASADYGIEVGSVQGTVRNASGTAIAGAHITSQPRGYGAVSDAAGAWRIDLLAADEYQLVAAADGYGTSTSDAVAVEADGVAELDLVLGESLDAGGVVTVTVEGPSGRPVAGAVVSASTGQSAETDDAGVAVLVGVVGSDLDVTVIADGLWSRTLSGATVTEGGGLAWHVAMSGRPGDDAGYVGTPTCSFCHDTAANHYVDTLHANALSTEPTDALLALFAAGETVDLDGDLDGATATLSQSGSDLVVTLTDSTGSEQAWTVGGWIGDVAHAAVPWTEGDDQAFPLPVGWIAATGEREGYPDAEDRLVGYQLERWFGGSGAFLGSEPDASTSAEAQCFACHSSGFELTARSDGGVDMAATAGSGRWRDGAVACERCHGPGEDHRDAASEDRPYFITSPQLLDDDRAREVCGQCHSRIVTEDGLSFPYTEALGLFQPGQTLADWGTSDAEHWPSGAAAAPRMQLDELTLSPHGQDGAWYFRCFDCHDPHGASTDDDGEMFLHQLRENPTDNSFCLSCHLDMDFEGDIDAVEDHNDHAQYDPAGVWEEGRCTACHMPPTAAGMGFSELSGVGDLSSHLFEFRPPQDTIDVFDDAGETELPVGEFPAHGCMECHAYNLWWWTDAGYIFPGPAGDPTLRDTHVEYQDAVDEKWP